MKLSALTTEKDRQEAERISRRRMMERQRKERIFDTKSRIFGLDCPSLEVQIAAKKRQQDEDKRRDEQFEDMDRKKAEEVAELERQEIEMKRKVEEEMNLFRKNCQKKESAREFDLNDQDKLRKEQPPRVTDCDPWLSVSGAQKFAGEDLSHAARLRAAKMEQRNWLQHQMEEKRKQLQENKLRDRSIFTALIATANREDEVAAMDVARKNELSRENAQFNVRLARERNTQRLSERMAEKKDNLAEIYNHLSSDMLTENPATASSALGRRKVLQSMYRGMNKSQVDAYRQAQLQQQEDQQRRLDTERRNESEWHKQESENYRRTELEQRQLDRQSKNEALDLKEENQLLAKLQLSEQDSLNKRMTDNRPSEEFFQQFNTTSR